VSLQEKLLEEDHLDLALCEVKASPEALTGPVQDVHVLQIEQLVSAIILMCQYELNVRVYSARERHDLPQLNIVFLLMNNQQIDSPIRSLHDPHSFDPTP
jgi:hypothetical protein